mgnify:CR=1 FL=1
MAVSRANKEVELQELETAFKGSESAILVDYKGTERSAGHRIATAAPAQRESELSASSENTLAKRALKGTRFESLAQLFDGTTAVAYTAADPVGLAKTLTTFAKTAPMISIKAAVVQGRAIKPAEVTDLAALPGKPELLRQIAVRAAGADGPDRQRVGMPRPAT